MASNAEEFWANHQEAIKILRDPAYRASLAEEDEDEEDEEEDGGDEDAEGEEGQEEDDE